MGLRALILRALQPVKPASPPEPELSERVTELEERVMKLSDDWEYVLERINRWSARMAAQKRHSATANLEAALTPGEAEIGDPGANEAAPDPEQLVAAHRAQLKAAIRRKIMGR